MFGAYVIESRSINIEFPEVGCNEKVKPEGDQTPRVCPRCHNGESLIAMLIFFLSWYLFSHVLAAVIRANSRTWFEVCWVPLIPMSKKHIWVCTICQWNIPQQQG